MYTALNAMNSLKNDMLKQAALSAGYKVLTSYIWQPSCSVSKLPLFPHILEILFSLSDIKTDIHC